MAVHRGLTVRSLLAAGPLPKARAQGSVISHRTGQVVVAEVRGEPQEEEKVCLFVRNRKIKQMTCWDVVKWALFFFFLLLCCLREKEQILVKIQPTIKALSHPKLFKDRFFFFSTTDLSSWRNQYNNKWPVRTLCTGNNWPLYFMTQ